jgi:HlyD family secretion protein
MKKKSVITRIVVILCILALFLFVKLSSGKKLTQENYAYAEEGKFEIVVTGAGQILPEKAVDIKGPDMSQYRSIRMAGLKITDIIPEGTKVKKGDYIATLDRTNFDNSLKDEMNNLKTLQDQLNMKTLDTAVVLSNLRDDIKNQIYAVEEARIVVEQSKYEPPATIRRAKLDLDEAVRFLEQKKNLYLLQIKQSTADIKSLKVNLDIEQRKVDDLENVLSQFVVKAPADGMLIYKTDRSGAKIKLGSSLDPFDPVVATLPDLSSMLSKIYISEIEVKKVKAGQSVQITLDAFQDKPMNGHVVSIANIGEVLPNSDSKMFEVMIKIDNSNGKLLPSMTSSNRVMIKSYDKVVYIPVECVQTGEDGIPFVFTKDRKKQVIIPGEMNDKNIIIEKGLKAKTAVWMRTPDDPKKFKLKGNDLITVVRDPEKQKRKDLAF